MQLCELRIYLQAHIYSLYFLIVRLTKEEITRALPAYYYHPRRETWS